MKIAVITGASSGIGRSAAQSLSELGFHLVVLGRSRQRTAAVAATVRGDAYVADFDHLDDVRAVAAQIRERYDGIDVLANNAGGLVGKPALSADHFERTFQHNYLAPFLLTNLLLPLLERRQGRVITTSSVANRFGRVNPGLLGVVARPYLGGWPAYANAKLAMVLFTRELAARTDLAAYCFHPGFVSTSFGRDTMTGRLLLALAASQQITADEGAAPLIALASGPDLDVASGTYFDGLFPGGVVAAAANDKTLASRLWETSAQLVGLDQEVRN